MEQMLLGLVVWCGILGCNWYQLPTAAAQNNECDHIISDETSTIIIIIVKEKTLKV